MHNLKLNEYGYITNWLVSGPKLELFENNEIDKNQLRYEKYLRSIIKSKNQDMSKVSVEIATTSDLGQPWEYYYNRNNWFVDMSTFYSLLTKIDIFAAVDLVVDEDITVDSSLWTYMAVDVWLNGNLVCGVDEPVYKPIHKENMSLELKKGKNRLFVYAQNLGVRDTRNVFGVQINAQQDKISVAMPDEERAEPFVLSEKWLDNIELTREEINFKTSAPVSAKVKIDDKEIVIGQETSMKIEGNSRNIQVIAEVNKQELKREFELNENVIPQKNKYNVNKNHLENMFEAISKQDRVYRGNNLYFSIFNVLGRYHTNSLTDQDEGYIYDTLDLIEKRIDCSDFLVNGLLRLIKKYTVSEGVKQRAKEVLLNYRFWMDEEGSDGMCFWSENHALMFYGNLLVASQMYPDEYFVRGAKKGSEAYQVAYNKCEEWICDIEEDGFEEFISAGYMCVTFGALLALVDFAPKELSERCVKLTDLLLQNLSEHTFKGSVIGPQGRVYRDVIYPFTQGVQGLIHLINPEVPFAKNEWLILMATSKYQINYKLDKVMNDVVKKDYKTGNAQIQLHKEQDFMLTSVLSEASEENVRRWVDHSKDEHIDMNQYRYVKSLNECYHGTTHFQSGVYGYQQHMWYGALDNECVFFTNHPGATSDLAKMRPGYWYGNGIMPAIKQQDNTIGIIYDITEDHPIHFTHLYWPQYKFEVSLQNGQWLFGKKGDGFVGVWCSKKPVLFNDLMTNCEYRVKGSQMAYYCVVGSHKQFEDFDAFMKHCENLNVVFNMESKQLTVDEQYHLSYKKCINTTQYI